MLLINSPLLLYAYQNKHSYLNDIHLQTEKTSIMRSSDSRRGLKPLTGLPQKVAQRPDRRDSDWAGAASQNQHAVTPPAHIHQRVVLLPICDRFGDTEKTKQAVEKLCALSGQ